MSKIALLGPRQLVRPLAAAGVEAFSCDTAKQGRRTLAELAAKKEHAIVFLLERSAAELGNEIAAAENRGVNIVLLPDHLGSVGFYQEKLNALIQKATGAA